MKIFSPEMDMYFVTPISVTFSCLKTSISNILNKILKFQPIEIPLIILGTIIALVCIMPFSTIAVFILIYMFLPIEWFFILLPILAPIMIFLKYYLWGYGIKECCGYNDCLMFKDKYGVNFDENDNPRLVKILSLFFKKEHSKSAEDCKNNDSYTFGDANWIASIYNYTYKIKLHHTTQEIFEKDCNKTLNEIQQGDLLFFSVTGNRYRCDYIGIYLKDDKFAYFDAGNYAKIADIHTSSIIKREFIGVGRPIRYASDSKTASFLPKIVEKPCLPMPLESMEK